MGVVVRVSAGGPPSLAKEDKRSVHKGSLEWGFAQAGGRNGAVKGGVGQWPTRRAAMPRRLRWPHPSRVRPCRAALQDPCADNEVRFVKESRVDPSE